MKRSIFTLVLIAFLTSCNGQVTPSSGYLIQDSSYGTQPWPLNIVTDMNINKTYLLTEATAASQTLSTTTGKEEKLVVMVILQTL